MNQLWIILGSFSGFLSVAMGAFGAHALTERLDARALAIYATGAQYQMYHALALLAVGLWGMRHPEISTIWPGLAFAIGTVLFSGSLYILAITGIRGLGIITPFGGVFFLIGWLGFALLALKTGMKTG